MSARPRPVEGPSAPKKPKQQSPVEDELRAMRAINRAISGFNLAGKVRILNWARESVIGVPDLNQGGQPVA